MPRSRLAALALVAFALAVPLGTPVGARPLDDVKRDGTLRVALYDDNAPFSAKKDGKPFGIDVDLAEAIAKQLQIKLDLRLVDAAENVDGDLRLNLWRGDLAGSPLADLMLHVPSDRIFALRNEQVFMTRPYVDQQLAFVWNRKAIEGLETVGDIGENKIAVEGNSASDVMMLTANGGQFRANMKHFKTFDEAAKAFFAGETPILGGTRANLEAALFEAKAAKDDYAIATLRLGGPIKLSWELGGAVKTDSRDLGYAVGDAITAFIADGTIKAIFEKYGVTFVAPRGY